MNPNSQRVRSRRIAAFWVIGIALLFYLPALGTSVVQREQELRVALTARSMADGGSWLLPDYLGQIRLRKPPLMYWAVAACYRLGNATDSAFLARLPSALAGVGLALTIFFAARGFMGQRRACVAALCCVTSLIMLRQGRVAETDVLLTFWTALAAWSGYRAFFRSAGWMWIVAAGLASGLGFMTKGPAAFVLPLLAWLGFALWNRPCINASHHGPRVLIGLFVWFAIALAIASPWYLYLWARAGSLAQLRQELSATFGETSQHRGAWYYYVYTLLIAFLPWSLALPSALYAVWRRARAKRALLFCLIWFITSFLALSATSSKQIHYCTLLIPPASLLVGWFLGGLLWGRPQAAQLRRRSAWGVAIALPMYVVFVSIAQPRAEPKQALCAALESCLPEVHDAERVFLVGRHRATIEFHAGRPIADMDSVKEAWRQSRPGDLIMLNTKNSHLPETPSDAAVLAEVEHRGLRVAIWRRL